MTTDHKFCMANLYNYKPKISREAGGFVSFGVPDDQQRQLKLMGNVIDRFYFIRGKDADFDFCPPKCFHKYR